MIQIDHFILGVPNLDEARKDFQNQTGVLPKLGGQHAHLGTHNALASLGESYFEVLALDSTLNAPENAVAKMLRGLSSSTYYGWALQTDNFEIVRATLSKASLKLSSVFVGSRQTPDGTTLNYESALIEGLDSQLGCAIPFFIKWINTVHPSVSSPQGCKLKKFTLTHRPDKNFSKFLEVLSLPIVTKEAGVSKLSVEMDTPRGQVCF